MPLKITTVTAAQKIPIIVDADVQIATHTCPEGPWIEIEDSKRIADVWLRAGRAPQVDVFPK